MAILDKVQQASGGVKFGANMVVGLQAVSETDQDAAMLATVLKAMGIGLSGGNSRATWSGRSPIERLKRDGDGKITTV